MAERDNGLQMRSKLRWGIVGIFALLFISAFFDAPQLFNRGIDAFNNKTGLGLPKMPEKPFSLGLDLQGGAHLVYQADTSAIEQANRAESVEGVRDVIERRVNGLGVSEPTVQTTKVGDEHHIIVELPGVTDVQRAIQMIGETPILEFKEVNTTPARELTAEEKKDLEVFNANAKKRAEEAVKKITGGADFGVIAKEYSDDPATKENNGDIGFISRTNSPKELFGWAASAKEGDVTKAPIQTPYGYIIAKRGAMKEGDMEVTAKHILICYLGASNCNGASYTKEEALKKAQEVYEKVTAANFSELAKQFSTDTLSRENGGDLGPIARGVMVKPFEDAVFGAKAGQIVGPVETEFGYHIIYKTGEEPAKEYALSVIIVQTKAPEDIVPPPEPYKSTGLSGQQLERAQVVTDSNTGAVQVSLQFNDEGKELFRQITERNVGQPVAIYLDGTPISIPTVQQPILDGQAVISGQFTVLDARQLAQRLNAGALPVPVELVSQQTVGATLGAEALQKSLRAGVIGLLLVFVFMILYYRLPGLLAGIALLVYVSLSLAFFKLVGVTLTLSGIAGFILTIGMAVDANVLIFERMKEELRQGKSLKASVEEGFLRAWASIRDSNLSTLFTAILLMWFGTSFVKGFAITLIIGILVHLFTAITVTRLMLRFIAPWFPERGNWLFLGAKKK